MEFCPDRCSETVSIYVTLGILIVVPLITYRSRSCSVLFVGRGVLPPTGGCCFCGAWWTLGVALLSWAGVAKLAFSLFAPDAGLSSVSSCRFFFLCCFGLVVEVLWAVVEFGSSFLLLVCCCCGGVLPFCPWLLCVAFPLFDIAFIQSISNMQFDVLDIADSRFISLIPTVSQKNVFKYSNCIIHHSFE